MFNLRDYQHALIAAIVLAWEAVRIVLAVLATGGGKTVCFATIMHDHVGASAAVVHRKEIVGQISMALAQLGVKHRIVAHPSVVRRIRRRHLKKFGKSFVDAQALCGVVSVQTLTSKSAKTNRELMAWVVQVTLAVFDEGHHYVKKGLWARAVELMHRAKILLVTATPRRADGLGLGADSDGFAEVMVEGPPSQWLIDQGYLCRFQYKAPKTDLNVADIPLTASGDFNARVLRERVVESHLVGDVVRQYQQFTPGKRAIVFATDVESAEDIARAFRDAGVPAAALSGETEQGLRDDTIDEFESGKLLVLVNVDLFDEGFDVPAADVAILARPTESLAKFLQMVGRVLRVVYAPGFDLSTAEGRLAAIAASEKPFAVVIDPVRNWERHGMPNWPHVWSLDGEAKTRDKSDAVPQRVCDGCTQPYRAFLKACPYCGHVNEPKGRSLPEQVDGNLFDLDVDGMAAIFAKQRAADMPDEQYTLDQIGRNIPAIGRSADLKRHQEAKYRRQVLRELVAWWVGCQQQLGRDMVEVHKRFYFRFKVDIGTAFTLDTKETDALIERITLKFEQDMTT